MDDHDGDGLTAGMAAAWGVRAPATKGPKPGLSLDRIVGAGVGSPTPKASRRSR